MSQKTEEKNFLVWMRKNFFCPHKIEKITLKTCPEILKFFSGQNSSNRRIHVPKCDQLYIKLGSVTIDKLEFIMYRIKKDNWLSHHPKVKIYFDRLIYCSLIKFLYLNCSIIVLSIKFFLLENGLITSYIIFFFAHKVKNMIWSMR